MSSYVCPMLWLRQKLYRVYKDVFMDILQDPNVTYMLLVAGTVAAVLALASPGSGIFEIGALSLLILAGVGIVVNEIPINFWAIPVLLLGAAFFALSVRRPRQWIFMVLSIAFLVLGSAYLFRSEDWWAPAVNPVLASAVSLVTGLFFWFVARKAIEAERARPRHDLDALVGAIGEAKTAIHLTGSVQVGGELWSARSDEPIPAGMRVRVLQREGFILKVEALEQRKS
ncbi:MAG: NfeD family protein [Anaerolineales bacterium]|nr:NfeD family protein [Anaerolineales bacterium]